MMTPGEASDHIIARREARNTLAGYARFTGISEPAAHHLLICRELERIERGEIDRLMICCPPGAAKSTYGSVLFPAWYLGRHPDQPIIAASHTSALADQFGRRTRNLFASREHRAVFGVGVAGDNSAAGRWATEQGGQYYACGVGGSVTGRRGRLLICDDPVASREDADSEIARARAWAWYVNDALTRLLPGGAQIMIATRWHEDDLLGRILERERDRWVVIELPMEAGQNDPLGRQPGALLWPEFYQQSMVETAKLDMRSWNALYQQNPVPDDGEYFKAAWIGRYDELPDGLTMYGASDFAVTSGGGDYTEHGVFGLARNGDIFVADWWRGQTAADVWIDRLCDLVLSWRPAKWYGEGGPIRRSVEGYLARQMVARKAHCVVEWLPSVSDKEARARSIQATASMGKLFFPRNSLWANDLIAQMLKFPAGKYDDGVDVLSLLGRGLTPAPTYNLRGAL